MTDYAPRPAAPQRTAEMVARGQVWVWVQDEPVIPPPPALVSSVMWPSLLEFNEKFAPGQWEVRGTGAKLE